ncbi:MAG: hypothetical protein KGH64_01505 [Candidatus Micrarchaeota archaeon]|nr:hypothetical protein [Candidatus Micrarchaeota archaeon]MDE1833993.1 hypothetical protein [Candidatus Micrarchaeota archaeon]MDE1859499.1 hypothetical protein [Candidatus Micrarchaeota archaeon]
MSLRKDQIEEEISKMKQEMKEIKVLSERGSRVPDESTSTLEQYFKDQKERNEKIAAALSTLTKRIAELETQISAGFVVEEQQYAGMSAQEEHPVSNLDATILNFIKGRQGSMACADDIKNLMNYKGRNAACARLKKLEQDGFLESVRLSHKIYYRYYAGKTTKTLIVSPPQ